MKKLFLLVVFFGLSVFTFSSFVTSVHEPVSNEEIQWMTWEEAVQANQAEPRKIFVDVYTNWCGWCKKMDVTTFREKEVVNYMNDHFYSVKLNAEQKGDITFSGNTFKWVDAGRNGIHQLAYALLDGRLSYPSYVTLNEKFERIMISPGYKQAPALLQELQFAKEEKYQEMTLQEYRQTGR